MLIIYVNLFTKSDKFRMIKSYSASSRGDNGDTPVENELFYKSITIDNVGYTPILKTEFDELFLIILKNIKKRPIFKKTIN